MSFPWVESPLCTDLYQITMAQGYFHQGIENRHSVFNLFFRKAPFKGGYAVAAGLADAIKFLSSFRVSDDDVQFLSTLRGNDNSSLFNDAFLNAIRGRTLELDIDAMPEGTLAFANEPLMRVSGPLWQAQWVETALLCIINFQTLIATKAARVCEMAGDDAVLEFGLRRAQGTNGGLSASRAAFIGGCAATSNVWAAQAFGIPCKGTHAHSWIMTFDDELTAFSAYADAMPNNCVFLVDTYNSIDGIKNAITVGLALREKGFEVVGIRLDSGDLAALSIEAR
ncbi:MAG: nicotinate phosphoribosyltransferase, partial [Planctomycetota bacterium]